MNYRKNIEKILKILKKIWFASIWRSYLTDRVFNLKIFKRYGFIVRVNPYTHFTIAPILNKSQTNFS